MSYRLEGQRGALSLGLEPLFEGIGWTDISTCKQTYERATNHTSNRSTRPENMSESDIIRWGSFVVGDIACPGLIQLRQSLRKLSLPSQQSAMDGMPVAAPIS